MIESKFYQRIISNVLLLAVVLTTTISNLDNRLNTKFFDNGTDSLSVSTTLVAAANRSETSYPTDDSKIEGLLYGDEPAESLDSVDDFVAPQTQSKLLDPTQIPAQKQPIIDRSNPKNQLLEKTGQMFDDSGVLSDD